ncbi:ferredoxin [Amycolatopsis speibonae]|uniref:Ferredoxin n=1 Tax=Amycolatopsis speibonae TaxID=1450224 RepID=A0ABV7P918_9PSEU
MTTRSDERLADTPLREVGCGSCGARVEVRKSSWEQTSIQWTGSAWASCLERQAACPGAFFAGCGALRQAITDAVLCGELPVHDPSAAPGGPH